MNVSIRDSDTPTRRNEMPEKIKHCIDRGCRKFMKIL